MKISILVPLYNEEEFVATLLERVVAAPLPEGFAREIIVADDGSTDASVQEVEAVAEKYPGVIRLLTTTRNQGKGVRWQPIADAVLPDLPWPPPDPIQRRRILALTLLLPLAMRRGARRRRT